MIRWEHALGALGFGLLIVGHGMGLFVAPPEAMMGDVGRILYAHVPTAWVCLVTYTVCFFAAVTSLWKGGPKSDSLVEASAEVGVLLNALLLFQGSVWARPTWGVFWTWDPRLTTSAVLVVAFTGVLVLRQLITQTDRRALISGVAVVLAYVDVPVVYFSIKWWNTLHQNFSSPSTVDNPMVTPLRIAAFGMLGISIAFMVARWRIALRRRLSEDSPPPLPEPVQTLVLH